MREEQNKGEMKLNEMTDRISKPISLTNIQMQELSQTKSIHIIKKMPSNKIISEG